MGHRESHRGAPVHPHACGEHFGANGQFSQTHGSSPRMWGTPIPHWRSVSDTAVHPHACGEHKSLWSLATFPAGSSPRMWGTLFDSATVHSAQRFIPTHVGNTFVYTALDEMMAVHPHACGEHRLQEITDQLNIGSSPRMWGTRRQRFIPTHVGNTLCRPQPHRSRAVHPHACGEHLASAAPFAARVGSSPRMWGTRTPLQWAWCHDRFIPTHVGNTPLSLSALPTITVHPHACGEHVFVSRQSFARGGSSPRMWGTRLSALSNRQQYRFIPTHVGNTLIALVVG